MKVRFLLDENLSPRFRTALLRLNPEIDVLRVGDPGTPALNTKDPDILRYLSTSRRLLVTSNRTSMPDHLVEHWEAGDHIWGLLWVRPKTSIARLSQDLLLVWEASEAEEWIDRLEWVPF